MFRSFVVAAAAATAAAAVSPGLFGLGASGTDYVLQSYDAAGKSTNIGSPVAGELIAQQLSSIDQANAIYYYIGYNTATSQSELVGLSLADGSVTSRTKLPFYEPGFVGVGQMLTAGLPDGSVIVGGQTGPNTGHRVGTLNPKTGKYNELASFDPTLLPVLGGVSSYSPKSNIFVMELGTSTSISWYWVNLSTNKTGTYPNCDVLETLDWDASRDAFIGVGLFTNSTRNVGIMDAASGACSVLGQVPGYFIIEAGQGALDATTGNLWTLLEPSGGQGNTPFDLVGISTKGPVKIISHNTMEACPNPDNCPWQLEYYYGSA